MSDTAETQPYSDNSIKELAALAGQRGIEFESGWVKQAYIDALVELDVSNDAGVELLDRSELKELEPTFEPIGAVPSPQVASGYVHTVHPDTGVDVVFVPGETLPSWYARVE